MPTKIVAWDANDGKSVIFQFVVKLVHTVVLSIQISVCGHVDQQKSLALVLGQVQGRVSDKVFQRIVVDGSSFIGAIRVQSGCTQMHQAEGQGSEKQSSRHLQVKMGKIGISFLQSQLATNRPSHQL